MTTYTQVMPSHNGIQGAAEAAMKIALTLNFDPKKDETKRSVIRAADIPAALITSHLVPRCPDDIWN